ncbi:MAG: amidohydrolase family protein [Candidatus Latescibacterota bacterium]
MAEHPVERARFAAIDAHNHLGRAVREGPQAVARLVAEMDACNLQACFDLDGGRGGPLQDTLQALRQAHPGRFYVLYVLSWKEAVARGGDFGRALAAQLQRGVEDGADGLKIHKSLGLGIRDGSGQLILPDDPRLDPLFARCGELRVPCLIHVADPRAFFRPKDRHNERWEELSRHPDWHFHGGDYPAFEELMESQERLVARHPHTVFQSAHVASCSEDLGYVSGLLRRYPNLYIDISARIAELGRQPYTARRFFLEHADRILYGTDVTLTATWQRIHMRFLETWDEHFAYSPGEVPGQGRWRICGIGLPGDVLEKVYRGNALRLWGPPR